MTLSRRRNLRDAATITAIAACLLGAVAKTYSTALLSHPPVVSAAERTSK